MYFFPHMIVLQIRLVTQESPDAYALSACQLPPQQSYKETK